MSTIDTLLTDDVSFNSDELELLNMEGTPEIEDVLVKIVFGKAFQEITEYSNRRRDNLDVERILSQVIEVQEKMATVMARIKGLEVARISNLKELNNWVERYNKWKNSKDYYQKFSSSERSKAYYSFINGLNTRKDRYWNSKNELSAQWDIWHGLKDESNRIIGNNKWIWAHYFNLIEKPITPYFTDSDRYVEDIDNQVDMYPTVNELVDVLRDTHIEEMEEYNKGESKGPGFWNWRNENKMKYQGEDEGYINSLLSAPQGK